jgi:hypothetical protein
MMTGASIILNHIEPDRVILAANGDFVDPEGADEDVEEEEGSNSFLPSTEMSSDTSTLTFGSAAMALGAAPIAAVAAPRGNSRCSSSSSCRCSSYWSTSAYTSPGKERKEGRW